MSPRSRQRLVRNEISRRQFLGRAGMLTGAVVLTPSLLAACGGDDDDDDAASGGGGGKDLKISNWTGYMDEDQALVKQFNKDTGLNATYFEDINDNEEYF